MFPSFIWASEQPGNRPSDHLRREGKSISGPKVSGRDALQRVRLRARPGRCPAVCEGCPCSSPKVSGTCSVAQSPIGCSVVRMLRCSDVRCSDDSPAPLFQCFHLSSGHLTSRATDHPTISDAREGQFWSEGLWEGRALSRPPSLTAGTAPSPPVCEGRPILARRSPGRTLSRHLFGWPVVRMPG